MYGKNLIFKTGGVDAAGLEEPLSLIEQGPIDTSCLISKRYALNDILEAYRTFEEREDDCLKVVITPWENAKTPQPKRRQEGHDKGPDYPPHERRTLQPIGDKSEKCATTNVTTTANSWPHDGRRAYQNHGAR